MSKLLHIAPGLALPLNAVTQKLAMLGRTGSGKTYGATKLAEEMYDAGAQIVALDPVGVWYGLRLASNGRDAGIAIPVFGGLHGDVPLEPSAGALIADLVVDRGISAICDVSQFEHDTDKARFGRDFASRFFYRKKSAPSAVHLFLEECQEFIPEKTQKGEEHMLHAFTRLWKLGRNFGIGGTLISQRPQEVNKKALNLSECVFAFQLTGPHERKALKVWIDEKGLDEDIDAILPKLHVGQARVWSPAWLKMSETVKIAEKRTFNASSTPEVGSRAKVWELAPIDLEKIRVDMAATIEKAKATDPRELQKINSELRAKIQKLERFPLPAIPAIDPIAINNAEMRGYSKGYKSAVGNLRREVLNYIMEVPKRLDEILTGAAAAEAQKQASTPAPVHTPRPATPSPGQFQSRQTKPEHSSNGHGEIKLVSGARRMLVALAQRRQGLTDRQLGLRAQVSVNGGSFDTYLSALRSAGLIDGPRSKLVITESGVSEAGDYILLPSGKDLLNHYLGELGSGGASRMLRILADAYPDSLDARDLGERANVSVNGGSFDTYLSKLRTLELITGTRSALKASEELF
jgi:hypothetical protein